MKYTGSTTARATRTITRIAGSKSKRRERCFEGSEPTGCSLDSGFAEFGRRWDELAGDAGEAEPEVAYESRAFEAVSDWARKEALGGTR